MKCEARIHSFRGSMRAFLCERMFVVMSENIEKLFDDDSKSKKRSANGAFNKVKGGRRGMVTASSYMTKKQQAEYARIGEDKQYNIYEEIADFETFLHLPREMRIKAYSNWLNRFPEEYIAEVWGANSTEKMLEYLTKADVHLDSMFPASDDVQETLYGDESITNEMDWISSLKGEIGALTTEEHELISFELENDQWRVEDWDQVVDETEEVRSEAPIGWSTYETPIPITDIFLHEIRLEGEEDTDRIDTRVNIEINRKLSKEDLIFELEELLTRVIQEDEKVYQVEIRVREEN